MTNVNISGIESNAAFLEQYENCECRSAQERVLRVQVCIAAKGPIRLAELARTLCLPKSSVSRIVTVLMNAGWVFRNPVDNSYTVTCGFAGLADQTEPSETVQDWFCRVIEDICTDHKVSFSLQEIRVHFLSMTEIARAEVQGVEADIVRHSNGILAAFFVLATKATDETTALRFLKTLSCLQSVALLRRKLMLGLLRNGEICSEDNSAISIGVRLSSGPPWILWLFASQQSTDANLTQVVSCLRKTLVHSEAQYCRAVQIAGVSPQQRPFLKALLYQLEPGDGQ